MAFAIADYLTQRRKDAEGEVRQCFEFLLCVSAALREICLATVFGFAPCATLGWRPFRMGTT